MKISSKFSLALLAGTILSTPTMAAEEKEITVDYLNSLTGPKVTWSESEGTYQINLAGKTWYYNYNKPEEFEIIPAEVKDFKFSEAPGTTIDQPGGAAINNSAGENYKDIKSRVFANNKVTGSITGGTGPLSSSRNWLNLYGGAIYNAGEMRGINADFINNSVERMVYGDNNHACAYGGAIYNAENATIDNIMGDFIGNYVQNESNYNDVSGGAIANSGSIGNITGDFIGNYAKGYNTTGGAIINDGMIGDITGDFIGNYATSGGVIANESTVGVITGDFIGNHASIGGAIINGGTIENIAGNFIQNSAYIGGAIINMYGNFNITGNILNNYAQSESTLAYGGVIWNLLGNFNITGNILNNYAQSENGTAYGGAIASTIGVDVLGTMEISTPSVSSKGQDIFLSGNYTEDTRGKIYNALHVIILPEEMKEQAGIPADTVDFAFDTTGGGSITINDNIDGSLTDMSNVFSITDDRSAQYNLAFRGDDVLNDDGRTTQYIAVNNDIINAGEVSVEGTTLHFGSYQHEDTTAQNAAGQGNFVAALNKDGSVNTEAVAVTSLSLTNAAFDIYNGYMDKVNLKGWSANNGYLHVDVDVANGTADVLNINGDVTGQTKVIVYAHSAKATTDKSILFATATGEAEQGANAFSVYRVYNSPYMFDVAYNPDGENGKEWSLTMDVETENKYAGTLPLPIGATQAPGGDEGDEPVRPTAPVYGEVVAYGALPAAALEQTRNMVDNIGNQIKNGRVYTRSCSFVDGYWNGEPYYNLWVNPTYYTSNILMPTSGALRPAVTSSMMFTTGWVSLFPIVRANMTWTATATNIVRRSARKSTLTATLPVYITAMTITTGMPLPPSMAVFRKRTSRPMTA